MTHTKPAREFWVLYITNCSGEWSKYATISEKEPDISSNASDAIFNKFKAIDHSAYEVLKAECYEFKGRFENADNFAKAYALECGNLRNELEWTKRIDGTALADMQKTNSKLYERIKKLREALESIAYGAKDMTQYFGKFKDDISQTAYINFEMCHSHATGILTSDDKASEKDGEG